MKTSPQSEILQRLRSASGHLMNPDLSVEVVRWLLLVVGVHNYSL